MVSGRHLGKLSKIRARGQFTVPAEVRKALSWPEGEVPVRVIPLPDEDGFKVERIATPRRGQPRRKLTDEEWEAIFESMRRISRSGRAVGLTEFLVKDRGSH
ncbi:MAG: hypothetical protein Q7R39_10525 [Dehalococcoidia bacterium]|nr:hypothetical protein [Dehalococcoidia bacterium]